METPKIEIHVNLDGMLIGDLETLDHPKDTTEMLDTLQRLVVGADIRQMPISMLSVISKTLLAEVQKLKDAPN